MLTHKQRMIPVWNTETIYAESLTMVRDISGVVKAPLMFKPKNIVSVMSATETEKYTEYMDWEYKDGYIYVLPESRIPVLDYNDICFDVEFPEHCFPANKGYSRFESGDFFHLNQIAVTYTCERGLWTGVKPKYSKDILPKTTQKLKDGEKLRITLIGDSISFGAQSSKDLKVEPFQPNYFDLLCEELSLRTESEIVAKNVSKSGMDSKWGVENFDELANDEEYDLLIIGFGMNDGGKTPEEFAGYIRLMAKKAMSKYKNAEIIFISTSTPNPVLTNPEAQFMGNQADFKKALEELANELAPNGGIAVADITGMQKFMHSRKRFIDTTSNNVNHPNDFFYRMYAQFLSGMLTEY